MRLLYLWPLGFFILIPAIIFLYLLKQKAEEHPFSSLYLWRENYKNIEATKPWEKLKNNLLMYLQILTMLALILALGAPYIPNAGGEYKNIVLVLDNSGSMNALFTEKKTRLDVAKEKALQYVEKMRGDTRVTILSSNSTAKIELAGASDMEMIKKALRQIETTDVAGNLEPSISLVESMAGQWDGYEAALFSDVSIPIGKVNGTFFDLSGEGKNGGVDYVNHTWNEDGTVSVLAKVTNYGTEDITTDINLYFNKEMKDIQNVSMVPDESKMVYFENIEVQQDSKQELIIKAELNEKDSLSQDNQAYDITTNQAEKKVLLVTDQNLFLEKAILTNKQISLYKTTKLEHIEKDETFDLYIFDGIMPKQLPPSGNLIFINPSKENPNTLFTVEGTKESAMVSTAEHELTNATKAFSFGVSAFQEIKTPKWAKSFLKSNEYGIGFIGTTDDRVVAVLAFDIHQSELPLKTEFPILVNQLVGRCVKSSLLKENVVFAGNYVDVNGKTEVRTQAGLYKIEGKVLEEEKAETLAVNFPTRQESKLKAEGTVEIEQGNKGKASAEDIKGSYNLRNIFVFVILLLLAAEWTLYIRKL